MDLTNDILEDTTFDPSVTHSPLQSILASPHTSYPNCTPFGIARELFVPVPFRHAAADGYIDDIITAMLDEGGWLLKGANAALLAVHTFFRPTTNSDPLPRPDAASIRKLIGEGTPDEKKTILGWFVDTRLFRIFLPLEKANEWIHSIKSIVKANIVNKTLLESTIGRLNHAGYILPQARYLLNRLRHFLIRCQKRGPKYSLRRSYMIYSPGSRF